MAWAPRLREVRHYPDHPAYAALLRQYLDEALTTSPPGTHVLFSAHSLPISVVRAGDPYPEDIQRTVRALSQGLPNTWSLAFQSRNGPLPWLKPDLEDEIQRLGCAGMRSLLVVPISFVSDHIETLWEIDQLYRKTAGQAGIRTFTRLRAFNDDPQFARVLADIQSDPIGGSTTG